MTATTVARPATTAAESPPNPRRRIGQAGSRLWQASPLTYLALIIAIVLSIFPIIWSFMIASRDNSAIYDYPPTFGSQLGTNLSHALSNEQASFTLGLINSLVVSSIVTVSVVLFSSLAGFAFAKLRFKGRNALLLTTILTMMVPTQLGLIPLYLLMVRLQWVGDLQAVIVPFLVSGFGVFMMRQYATSAVPDELIEAARIDGCNTWRIYWSVVLPALRPAIGVLGVLTFMQTWNEFLWPFIVLNADTPTVQVSLKILAAGYYNTDYAQVFGGTILATVPLLIVFFLFGRQIISGIMEGSVKA
jgi:cellobiose transport system permease protein